MGWMNFLPLVAAVSSPLPPSLPVCLGRSGSGGDQSDEHKTAHTSDRTTKDWWYQSPCSTLQITTQTVSPTLHPLSLCHHPLGLKRNKGWKIFLYFRSDGLISLMTTLSPAMRGQTQCRPPDSRPTSNWIVNIQAFNSSSSRFRNKLRNMIKMWLVTAVGGQTDYFFQCFRHIFLVFS